MIDVSGFIVRKSGRSDACYIDCRGLYKVTEIAKEVGMDASKLADIYISHDGKLDRELDVYYFSDTEKAKEVIKTIVAKMNSAKKCRSFTFTEAEIEYIRKALINDGCGNIGINNKLKDSIFKKLNY